MKKSIILILVFTSLIWSNAFSQKFGISDQPDQFIKDVTKYLKSSTKEKIRTTGGEFEGFWESDLAAEDQKKIAGIGAKLKKSGFTYSHFDQWLSCIMGGSELDGFVLADFLEVSDKVVENETKSTVRNFLSISNLFINDSCLVRTNFNSISPMDGSFKFEYKAIEEEKSRVDELLEKAEEREESEEDEFEDWDEKEDDSWNASDEGEWIEEDEGEDDAPLEPEENVDLKKRSAIGYEKPTQPKVFGPIISFTNMDLNLISRYDTAVVEQTSGEFMFANKLYVANGGKMDWRSAGLEEGSCFVELGEWHFNMAGTRFRAENVDLSYPDAIAKKVQGVFEFKTQNVADRSKAVYPRFMSYHSVSEYKNLGEGVTLSGGFSMEGRRINTSCVDGEIGKLSVKYGGQTRFRAIGKRFDILDTTLYSRSVGIIVFMGRDSLLQPSMALTYGLESNLLELSKGNRQGLVPFMDTYHKVEITAEKLSWDLNTPEINMSIISAPRQIPILIESNHYYNDGKYIRLRGIGSFHPLQSLVYYAKKKKKRVVYVADVAKAYKKKVSTYAGAMSSLAKQGFVSFDRSSGKVTLKDKAYFYVKARRKKTDFDNIVIKSKSGSKNGVINLETNELTLNGVKRFYLSDTLVVYNEPRDGKVVIKKNRNMLLHGKLVAGKYFFICDSMEFNYDRYEIELNKIDSIQFSFKVGKEQADSLQVDEGERELGLAVDYASGMLYIDKPNNKGTLKKNPGYPFFDAVTGARVHFSDSTVLGGVYSEEVYFHIPPFDIDSLNSVDPNKANFEGTFHSGGIFPEFDEILTVRPERDLSFGFVHEVPEEGYPIYGKKSKFKGKIDMSDFGMHGAYGKIEHITSELYADDFIFYPDSVHTDAGSKIDMRKEKYKETSFPQMKVENYKMHWDIGEDSMHLWNKLKKEPFKLYEENAFLRGRMTIMENGAFGDGVVKTNHALASSKLFNFHDDYFTGSYTEFKVNSDTKDKPALLTKEAKLRFDMVKLEAIFGPEEEGFASTEFPFMQYKTSLAEGHLKIKEDIVEMKMEEGGDIEDSYFYSTNPDQDSLVFNATHAVCDLKHYKLDISGIPYIKVGDSKVLPDSGEAHIEEYAHMRKLKNAKLLIDTLNEYHPLHSANVEITSRTKIFSGKADYEYVVVAKDTTESDTFQIHFSDFKMLPFTSKKREDRFYTRGVADVEEEEAFYISPRIQYKGNINLDARKEFLDFNGFVKLDLKSSDISDYFAFVVENVDPEDVRVDMSDPKDETGVPLHTGLFIDETTDDMYSAFVALKESESDLSVLDVKGKLFYDKENFEFTIADTHKLRGDALVGSVMILNDSTTNLEYEGKFNFHENTKDFQFFAAGFGKGNVKRKEYNFNTLSMLQYRIPSSLLRRVADTTFKYTRDEFKAVSYLDTIAKPMAELAGERAVKTMLELSESTGEVKPLYEYSSKMGKSFVLTDMIMHWNHEESSLYCEDTFGLSNVGKSNVNVRMHGKLEVHKNAEGDEINFLLQPDSVHWYYFSYRDNILYMISSDYEFNKYVHKRTKLEERKEKEYMIALGTFFDKAEFEHKYITRFYKQEADSINEDSLDIAYNNMVASFVVEKGTGKEEDVIEEESDDGFEELDTEDDFEENPSDTTNTDTDDSFDEEDDEEDFNNDDLEEEFENSSITNVKLDKKFKKKKDKGKGKDKKEEKSDDVEEDDASEDDLEEFDDEEDDDMEDLGDDEEEDAEEEPAPKPKKKKKEKKTKEEPVKDSEEEDLEDLDLDDEDF